MSPFAILHHQLVTIYLGPANIVIGPLAVIRQRNDCHRIGRPRGLQRADRHAPRALAPQLFGSITISMSSPINTGRGCKISAAFGAFRETMPKPRPY
ncbi:hypothetical protein RR46_14083 [Papilio xuthus]|uniref:Uncharacterized protein n=1 Tax=Papilio xuthus TaxID=66420 RepID=A0A194PHR9_PAPXU|nr:hypothetical protein RR46_14083 [Papilio xuthus]